jgi:hypothetical protein
MTIESLSPELKQQLLDELKADELQKAKRREAEIESYKGMQDGLVIEFLPELVGFSILQKDIINKVFKSFDTLVTIKKELYSTKESQDSHTFTARDGSGSITIGFNSIIAFDGTETAGVQKVKQYIETLSGDEENRDILAGFVETFMKVDKKGNLNPTRIVELVNKKSEINDPLFSDGVDTIVKAQFKTRTSTFVKGWQRTVDGEGKEVKITFSISA